MRARIVDRMELALLAQGGVFATAEHHHVVLGGKHIGPLRDGLGRADAEAKARAVVAAWDIPTTSREKIRGTMVMRRASSHMPPTGSATARTGPRSPPTDSP